MPLFPYLPMIVWMGVIQVMLGARSDPDVQSVDDSGNLTTCASILPFRTRW